MTPVIGKILKESFPVLILCTIGGVMAGIILEGMKEELAMIPGLLVLLPAILGNRGNISGALGSRLASALHLGMIEPQFKLNKPLQDNIAASLILNVMMSLMLGIVAYYAYVLTGLHDKMPASIIQLTLISFISGTLAGLLLTFLSVAVAIITYSRGLDPDNVLIPLLATGGDILTVLCLLFAARIVI